MEKAKVLSSVKDKIVTSMNDRIELTKKEIIESNKKHDEEIKKLLGIIEECKEIIKKLR